MYRDEPAKFVLDCLKFDDGDKPTSYQLEILNAIPKRKRVAVRGPHGLGKSAVSAWAVLWFFLTRDNQTDWKVPTTASAWRQLQKFLWPEIHKWAKRVKWNMVGRDPLDERTELLSLSIRGKTGEAFALASDQSELIEGAHASELLYIFDESKVVPDKTWDSAEGAFSTGDCHWLAVSTPGLPQGRFYQIHKKQPGYEDWWTRHVSLSEFINQRNVSPEWAEQRKRQWGENSSIYINRVLGNFAASEEDTVISISDVERAIERWHEIRESKDNLPNVTCIGVDVGRGGNESAYAIRRGNVIWELREDTDRSTMNVTGKVVGLLNKFDTFAVVDVVGIGAGVVDRIRELGLDVRAFNSSNKTQRRDKSGELGFFDSRSAAWWNLRELLQEDSIALPDNDELIGELTSPKWEVMSGGKIKVESKKRLKRRIGRSTDRADAVVMSFFLGSEKPAAAGESVDIDISSYKVERRSIWDR